MKSILMMLEHILFVGVSLSGITAVQVTVEESVVVQLPAETAALPCTFNGAHPGADYSITWECQQRNHRRVLEYVHPSGSIYTGDFYGDTVKKGKSCSLIFLNPRPEHSAVYWVTVTVSGQDYDSASVRMSVLPPRNNTRQTASGGEQSGKEDGTITTERYIAMGIILPWVTVFLVSIGVLLSRRRKWENRNHRPERQNVYTNAVLFFTFSVIFLFSIVFVSHMTGQKKWWHKLMRLSFAALMTSSALQPEHMDGQTTCTHALNSIAFVKVPKAGSTTVMNVLQRYAWDNDIFVALPTNLNLFYQDYSNVVPLPEGRSYYNMLFNHVHHYNRQEFAKLLHVAPDAKYIAIVREPLSLTISAFRYLKIPLYENVPGPDKLGEFLRHREKYDPLPGYHTGTNNRMAFTFGLPLGKFRNKTFIQSYLKKLDSEFDLVMVLEYFAESMVLLKRLMCWSLKDVLYITRNANAEGKPKHQREFTEKELAYHRNISLADSMFYDHFLERLKQRLHRENSEFWDEVSIFKDMLAKTVSYCQNITQKDIFKTENDSLVFRANRFSQQFEVRYHDCQLMLLDEMTFVQKSREKHERLSKQRQWKPHL